MVVAIKLQLPLNLHESIEKILNYREIWITESVTDRARPTSAPRRFNFSYPRAGACVGASAAHTRPADLPKTFEKHEAG